MEVLDGATGKGDLVFFVDQFIVSFLFSFLIVFFYIFGGE
jgi:hypothetical protein